MFDQSNFLFKTEIFLHKKIFWMRKEENCSILERNLFVTNFFFVGVVTRISVEKGFKFEYDENRRANFFV